MNYKNDEQGQRIAEEYESLMEWHKENGTVPSYSELESVFEDRDPFEFL
jgi:DNA gyrase inhibitor GyrI